MSGQTDHTLEPLVRKLAYRVRLDDADRDAILQLPYRTRRLERREFLVREGDRNTHSSVLLSGFAMRNKIVGGGARQILAIHVRGEMMDLQNSLLRTADHSVQALTDAKVALVPREAMLKLAFEWPHVGKALWLDSLVDASVFREWIANVGRRDARTRIAHLLCEFSLRLNVAGLGEECQYELPMTQEEIADCTGLTSVHVNRTLKALEEDRLIERQSRRTVVIGDWRKLADVGDFDSAYLHLDENEPALA